ncbi:ribonucleotide-diphosphate reductase subunit alpha, partial [Enterococcus faecalis]|nr:ribonucleotide-diphosphate reductase subunit alpha [Enterococcus faecalis]
NMMTSPDFGKSIRTMTRALTYVTDASHIHAVPTVNHGNELAHTFGLGAMGLHSYLAQNLMEYGSPESIEFTSIYFMLMNYWTLVESNNIARERGVTFHNFDKSDYANGSYFDKYTDGRYVPQSDKVKELFSDIFIPTAKDWADLKAKVMADGLYHQNRLAVAPNGSISYINDVSASIHP